MVKKFVLIVLLFSNVLQAQKVVSGELNPVNEEFSWVSLYRLTGAKQVYINNSTLDNGKFLLTIPKDAPKGMYRLLFKMDNKSYIDFIYTQNSLEIKLDPLNPKISVEFKNSNENSLLGDYKKTSGVLKERLDSIQYSVFYEDSSDDSKIELYEKTLNHFQETQEFFESKSKGTTAFHFITAENKYFSPKLFENAQEYINSLRTHFFDYIDFTDNVLMNSTLISEKVINYVFFLNSAEDYEVRNALFKNATKVVVDKAKENPQLKAELVTSLMYSFAQIENMVLLDFLMDNYYKKLPLEFQNEEDLNTIFENTKLAIGRKAPDFSWKNQGSEKSLSTLGNSEYYVLVFWSTTCSHCINDIPKLYDFMKGKEDVNVILISLETDDIKFKEYEEKFKNWTTVLALGKWNNPIAKSYKIVSTPTYFILNSSKTIIAKPENLEDVKEIFTN